jgi:signal peptidase I
MFPTYGANTKVVALRYLASPSRAERGEILVYREARSDGNYDYVWRVIGLPGETVEIRDDVVFIDGSSLTQELQSQQGALSIRREHAGSRTYLIAVLNEAGPKLSNSAPVVVPAGQLFLMGDNRHNAHDSRLTGCVPLESVRARVLGTLIGGRSTP